MRAYPEKNRKMTLPIQIDNVVYKHDTQTRCSDPVAID